MDPAFADIRSAAYEGDFDRFVALLEASPNLITATSSDRGDSPNLIQFIVVEGGLGKIEGATRFLSYLIDNGASTVRQLVAAASVNARVLVDVLLDAGSPIDDGGRWTALDEAVYWNHTDLARYLVGERGAEVSSLGSAAGLGRLDLIAEFFVDGRLRPSVLPVHFPWGPLPESTLEDALGQAFILAVRSHELEAAQHLLDAGMDINAIPAGHHEEATALHQAAGVGDRYLADWLIDRGALGTVLDNRFNATAIQWAGHEGHRELEKHLDARLG